MSDSIADLMPLTVAGVTPLAAGIRAFELRAADGGELPPFAPGAHVTVRTPSGLLRKYSLCNDSDERDRYVIAVKREPSGRGGSASVADNCRVGDVLPCSAPHDFALAAKARGFLFVAGGIGITPIMSMLRHLANDGTRRSSSLPDAIGRRDGVRRRLNAPAFAGNVVFHHDGGDPDRVRPVAAVRATAARARVRVRAAPDAVAIRDMSGHWPMSSIHIESFADAATLAAPRIIRFACGSPVRGRPSTWARISRS